MQTRRGVAMLAGGLACLMLGARPEARILIHTEISTEAAVAVSADLAATHEMLEGSSGRRETWATAPTLLIETSVMDYASGDLSRGFVATAEKLSDADIAQLTTDLTAALDELTAGTIRVFGTVNLDAAPAGHVVKVLRAGQIVVGRFRGVQDKTGNLGFGARLTHDGTISQAAVVLDAAFDRESDQRALLRTHELGHALGFNHVESRPSVMNPRVGSSITAFDRAAIRAAFLDTSDQR